MANTVLDNPQIQIINSLIREGKFKEALIYIEKGLGVELEPTSILTLDLENLLNMELVLAYITTKRLLGFTDEVIQVTEALLESVFDESHEVKILEEMGMAYNDKGDLNKAYEVFSKIKELPLLMESKEDWARIQRRSGRIHWQWGNLNHAEKHAKEAIEVFNQQNNEEELAYTLSLLANVIVYKGKYREALKTNEKALEIFEKRGMKYYKSIVVNNIGEIYRERGETEQALKYYQQALTLGQEMGDQPGVSIAYMNMAHVYKLKGNFEKAHNYYQESVKAYPDIGESFAELFVEWGQVEVIRGNYAHAKKLLIDAKKIAQQRASDIDRVLCFILEGFIVETGREKLSKKELDKQGSRKEQAVQIYGKALELSSKVGYSIGEILSSLNLARVLVDMGKIDDAESVVESIERISKRERMYSFRCHARNLQALILSLRENYQQALILVSQAKNAAEKFDLPALARRSEEVHEFISMMQHAAGPMSLALKTQKKTTQNTQEATMDFFYSYLQEIG